MDDNNYYILKKFDDFSLTKKESDNDDKDPYDLYRDINHNNKMIYATSTKYNTDDSVMHYPAGSGLQKDEALKIYEDLLNSPNRNQYILFLLRQEKQKEITLKKEFRR